MLYLNLNKFEFNKFLFALTMFLGMSDVAWGYSHSYINMTRSSMSNNFFVSQAVEGEFGQYKLKGKTPEVVEGETPTPTDEPISADWRGTGIKTTLGIEMMKFLQLSGGHTFVNTRSQEDGLENMAGSKLHLELKMSFLSPIGNLELGAGAVGSKLEYRRATEISDFAGTGVYYTIGVNYFLNSKISTFANMRVENTHYVRSGGSASVKTIDTNTTHIGAGFSIWI